MVSRDRIHDNYGKNNKLILMLEHNKGIVVGHSSRWWVVHVRDIPQYSETFRHHKAGNNDANRIARLA